MNASVDQADGSRVVVASYNHPPATEDPVETSPGRQPLDVERLGNLVTLPGLEF
jgi:hypothetical protein